MPSKANLTLGIVIVAIVLIASTYSLINQKTPPLKNLTITGPFSEANALVWIAAYQGYFEDHGLNVIYRDQESRIAAIDELIQGKADIVATVPAYAVVRKSFEHNNLRVITALGKGNPRKILANKDHGISQPRDLKGKEIGITQKSGSEYTLGKFLEANNLTLNDVQIVDQSPQKIAELMLAEEIDAGVIENPYAYDIEKRLTVVSWQGIEYGELYFLAITTEEFTKEHSKEIEKFLEALIEAEQFVKENPAESQRIIARRLNLDLAYFLETWPNNEFRIFLDDELPTVMENEAQWIIQQDLASGEIPNPRNLVSADSLRKVKPEAATI